MSRQTFVFSAIVAKKTVTYGFSETVTIEIIPVSIKAVVIHHVGLYWMMLTKEQYGFSVEENFIEWCKGGPWFNDPPPPEPKWPHI